MNEKEKRLSIAGVGLAVFLFLCAVINFISGHTGAAICALGAGIFFLVLSAAVYKKSKGNDL